MRKLPLVLISFVSLAGCQGGDESLPVEDADVTEGAPADKADSVTVSFDVFTDPKGIGSAANSVTRKVITSQTDYVARFGHKAPRSVDFTSQWVIFYTPGTERTGGYAASIEEVRRSASGKTLYITTSLESPGSDCLVTQMVTHPAVLATIAKQNASSIHYYKDDAVRSCDPCATVRCRAGTHCQDNDGSAECVADAPHCGGIAARPCPGRGECVDDPTDSCDPAHGGADCGGICTCPPNTLLCLNGMHWDGSPSVCACVADAGVPCGTTTCGAGLVCCNPLMNICTPPGMACIQ